MRLNITQLNQTGNTAVYVACVVDDRDDEWLLWPNIYFCLWLLASSLSSQSPSSAAHITPNTKTLPPWEKIARAKSESLVNMAHVTEPPSESYYVKSKSPNTARTDAPSVVKTRSRDHVWVFGRARVVKRSSPEELIVWVRRVQLLLGVLLLGWGRFRVSLRRIISENQWGK